MHLIALLIGLAVERLATQLFHLRRLRWLDRIIDVGFRQAQRVATWPALIPVILIAVLLVLPVFAITFSLGDALLGFPYLLLAIVVLFFLPWLDRSSVKSIRYRGGWYKLALAVFVVSFLALGWLGTQPATQTLTWFARLFSILYFAFFLLMPFYTKIDKTKPVPDRVTFK